MFTVYCDFNKKYDKNSDTLFKGRVYLKLHAKIGMELDRMIQQEAHGPHRLPVKQFQLINTFAKRNYYAITLRDKSHCLLI